MSGRKRAISAEQKEERRAFIMDTARRLYAESDFESIQMDDVARQAGLAKGTLYLYFPTKESLFLAILSEAFASWFNDLERILQEAPLPQTPQAFSARLIKTFQTHQHWVRLAAISHTILERNIEPAAAADFKRDLLRQLQHAGKQVEACLPFLTDGMGQQVLLHMYAILVGVQNLAEPAPVVRQVLATYPGLAAFQIDFTETYQAILVNYLTGLAEQYQRSTA